MNEQHAPLNILLADDDVDDRFFFDKALKEIPVTSNLVTVSNGELLMQYLADRLQHLPDVLFLDLSMPRKTGFECLAEIKDNEKLKNLPVIIFTTSFTRGIDFEDNLKKTFSRMGADDYIRKPGDFDELKEVIQQALLKMLERNKLTQTEGE
jgi:CheY-like chemotaxis protein